MARALAVASLLLAGFAVQAYFAAAYPQPDLFGDPQSYHKVGRRLVGAWARWMAGEGWQDALESVRGVLYFAGAGTVYGVIDALRPGDLLFLRLVFAGFNTLSMLGGFMLARRLSGSFAGGMLALGVLVAHPSFSVELAKLFPDPVTGCCFTWSAVAFVEALGRGRAHLGLVAGLALGAGLFVRSQLLMYVVPLLAVTCLIVAWVGRHHRLCRSLALCTLLGVTPFVALWGMIVWSVGSDVHEIEALGNFTFKSGYPYGFWQFLDSDGWMGPFRLRTEPYYRALEVDAVQRGWPVASRPHQVAFTARYVASRPLESAGLVLDNAYRLYDRPPNRYKWDYPYSYTAQVAAHRSAMLLALLGLVLFASIRPAHLAVLFLPLSIALLHAVSYPWLRFAQPVLPILLASAGALGGWMLEHRRDLSLPWVGLQRVGALAVCTLALAVAGALLRDGAPEAGRCARLLATLLALGLPFLALVEFRNEALNPRRIRALGGVVWLVLAAGVVAHALRSPSWHQSETTVGKERAGVEQEIWLSAESRQRLRAAPEALLVMDLRVVGNGLSALRVEVNGRSFSGTALAGTLPRLGEFTLDGGPDRSGFAQWWMLRLPSELLSSSDGSLRVRLLGEPGQGTIVYGDRFTGDQAVYEGPSFGDWPHVAGIKFDYDGDPRLAIRLPLSSERTVSALLRRDGRRQPIRGVFRIRVLLPTANEGTVSWEGATIPAGGQAALHFAAAHGNGGMAEMLVQGRKITDFPIGRREDYVIAAPPYTLCYRGEARTRGPARGTFLLSGPFKPGQPAHLTVRFHAAMSDERLFFLPSRGEPSPSCPVEPHVPLIDGAARVLDSSQARYPQQTGRWRVAAAF